jgi:hypothetical protein
MPDREVIRRLVRDVFICIDERRIRIAENVGVGLVFHHDEENVIEPSEAARRYLKLDGVGDTDAQRNHGDSRDQQLSHNNPLSPSIPREQDTART